MVIKGLVIVNQKTENIYDQITETGLTVVESLVIFQPQD